MNTGIKATSKNAADAEQNHIRAKSLPHILLAIAFPYLTGSQKQLERYKEASNILKQNAVLGVQLCLHEASCLFEDLTSVARYVELTGEQHALNKLWYDVRNHIRHDFREGFDKEDKRKTERNKSLGINPKLQTSIAFDENSIKIGATVITVEQINDYLIWAGQIITNVLNNAQKEGLIKNN